MHDTLKGLKAREEMLNELRFFFRNEEQLIKEGWYTEGEFSEAVTEVILEGFRKMNEE